MTITGPKRRSITVGYSGHRVCRRSVGGITSGKRSSPGTPLVPWKLGSGVNVTSLEIGRVVSARELGGIVWRLQLPETDSDASLGCESRFDRGATHVGLTFLGHQKIKARGCEAKELKQGIPPVTDSRKGYTCKFKPLFELPDSAVEGATKWNPGHVKTSEQVGHVYNHSMNPSQPVHDKSAISVIKSELEKAHERIHELETEKRSSKKKLEHFLKKLSEERAAWRSKEHEKICAVIDDFKANLRNERKNRQRLEIVNSNLVKEVADAKLLVNSYMQGYEKERKARELIEEVCDELAKEISEDKYEVEALKRESMEMRAEVEDERRMLQMAEVWREERVQMKLIDAKVLIEERYTYMNNLVADVDAFLISSRSSISDPEDIRKAELIQQAAASVNVQDIKELTCESSDPDDIISVLNDVSSGDATIERKIEPRRNMFIKNTIIYHSGEIEEEESGWETESQVEDQGSSYSPEGSEPSVNENFRSTNDCGRTPIIKVSEVCSTKKIHNKKVSAMARPLRSGSNNGENFKSISVDGMNGGFSHSRLSNEAIISPEQWSSQDLENQHVTRVMKGCTEWPGGTQKSCLKGRVLVASMDCQKIQLKQVLQQKI